jgi:hypothetical protein
MIEAAARARVEVSADRGARGWLAQHPEITRLFITFMSSRACCSGARVCDVRVRADVGASRRANAVSMWTSVGSVEGREVLLDARLVERMPAQPRLTVRGLGPFRRLDLDLTGEQWAELLYPVAW